MIIHDADLVHNLRLGATKHLTK